MAASTLPGTASGGTPIGVLVVDDQFAVREGVVRLIAGAPIALRGIGQAASCEEAHRIAALLRPEVVVLDADLAGQDGLSLIGQLGPVARFLVLTCHGDAATRARAKHRGAVAFIEKQQPAADLLQAIVEIIKLPMEGDKAPPLGGASSQRTSVTCSGAVGPKRP